MFAVRCDLFFPCNWTDEKRLNLQVGDYEPYKRDFFSRFIDALKQRLAALEKSDRKQGKSARSLTLEYARAIEFKGDKKHSSLSKPCAGNMHIHTLLLFNGQRFKSLGKLYKKEEVLSGQSQGASQRSVGAMIIEAWGISIW